MFFLLAFLDTPLRHDPEHGARPAFAAGGAALMAIATDTLVSPDLVAEINAQPGIASAHAIDLE